MPKEADFAIGRSVSVSFAEAKPDDQELRARLDHEYRQGKYRNFTEFAKHLFRIALDAQQPQAAADVPEELLQKLTVIQQQLAELRHRDLQLESLTHTLQSVDQTVGDISRRTNGIHHALGAAMVGILVDVAEWDGEMAMSWVKKNVMRKPND